MTIKVRMLQVPRNPPINAEVDERREGPYVLWVGEAAEGSGDRGDRQVDRKRPVFAMPHGRQCHGSSTTHRGQRAHENAENDRRLEGDIGCQEVGNAHPDPYTEGQRSADEGDQLCRLAKGAVGEQQQFAEGFGSRQRTRNRRRDAKFDQQRD